MDNMAWGLYMTVAGMGTVFLLLALLMLVLLGIGKIDPAGRAGRADPATADDPALDAPAASPQPDDLSPEMIAAITIAVITHANRRRGQVTSAPHPLALANQPPPSRWVSIGRTNQTRPWSR